MTEPSSRVDVAILGAGQAGLSLARQLLLESEKTVLVLDRASELPPARQKVGEATVQVSGYYFGDVLDLEEHLLREHYMKYNLRFLWKSAGRDNRAYEDFAQSYIRSLSNVPSYQLDRNALERELLRRNAESPRFTLIAPARNLAVELAAAGSAAPHRLRFTTAGGEREVSARWVVDASGRSRFLARRLGLTRPSPIRHGASFLWVDGLLDVERLSGRSPRERRLAREKRAWGHLPMWLATNHFAGDGFWVWVIPLQGRTSIGVVYDTATFPHARVRTAEGLVEWICEELPLFARDLPQREVVGFSGFRDYAHDCAETLSTARWAMTGEAGRFSDPLYSPGGDLIALHNTLITATITAPEEEIEARVPVYEQLLRAVYEAYVPSYSVSYHVLGDQEAYSLKYTWELTVYFALYVFPFVNDLFADRRFALSFLRTFSRLGPVNRGIQTFLGDYVRWKKEHATPPTEPTFFDFSEIGSLRTAESTFYRVGVDVEEAREVLGFQYANLEELARFVAAHVSSVVVGDERLLEHRGFVEGIAIHDLVFDPAAIRRRWRDQAGRPDPGYTWSFDPHVLRGLRPTSVPQADDSRQMLRIGTR